MLWYLCCLFDFLALARRKQYVFGQFNYFNTYIVLCFASIQSMFCGLVDIGDVDCRCLLHSYNFCLFILM